MLASDVDLSVASPTLRLTGAPPATKEWEPLFKLPEPAVGSFGFKPVVPPALQPLAHLRASTTTTALAADREVGAWSGRAGDAVSESSGGASGGVVAGSAEPRGPALADPDGISAAVCTLRKFRGLIEGMPGKPVAREPPPPREGLEPPPPPGGVTTAGRLTMRDAGWGGASGGAGDSGGGVRGWGSPLVAGAPPEVAAAVASSATGSAVIGTLLVPREHLMRATIAAAKWTRIRSTEYGTHAGDPCRMVLEMQRGFYTPFLNDMHDATGGDFEFTTEATPTAIQLNIGAINMMIQQGATDFTDHLLPGHRSNKRYAFKVTAGPTAKGEVDKRSMRRLGLLAVSDAAADASLGVSAATAAAAGSDSGAGADDKPRTATALVLRTATTTPSRLGTAATTGTTASALARRGESRGSGASPTRSGSRGRSGGGHGATLPLLSPAVADEAETHAAAPLVWHGERYMSASSAVQQTFMASKAKTLLRVGRGLAAAARAGDVRTMTRLVLKGEPVYLDPRTWYEREGHEEGPEGDTPATNPHVVTTDAMVKAPVDWADVGGETALMAAVRASAPEAVRALLQMGADTTVVNAAGETAISIGTAMVAAATEALRKHASGAVAARKAAGEVMAVLDDRSLLQVAADGDLKRAKYLLAAAGVDVNVTNQYGMTPLHFAVMREDDDMVRLLMEAGANPRARNNLGQTPLTMADDARGVRGRERLAAAFTAGRAEDAERRRKLAEAAEHRQAERAELAAFERQLRTLTRGTAAAKTLVAVTHIVDAAATAARSARGTETTAAAAAAATGSSARGGPLVLPPTDHEVAYGRSHAAMTRYERDGRAATARRAASAAASARPLSAAMTAARPTLNGTTTVAPPIPRARPGGGGAAAASPSRSPRAKDAAATLYDDAERRHVDEYVAVSARAGAVAAARGRVAAARPKGLTGSATLPPTLAPGTSAAVLDTYRQFYSAPAPPPSDRTFDLWFKAHISPAARAKLAAPPRE